MGRYFISVPMFNKTDREIQSMIDRCKSEIQKIDKNARFIDSRVKQEIDARNQPLAYLAKSLELLANADAAVFYGDYTKARGCLIEHRACIAYGIPRHYVQEKRKGGKK